MLNKIVAAEKKYREAILGMKYKQILRPIAGIRVTITKSILFRELCELRLDFVWLLRSLDLG